MKSRIRGRFGMLALVSIVLAANSTLTRTRAQVAVSAGVQVQSVADFYGPMASYGTWYNLPADGRCWHPADVTTVWRPYTVGYWEWTDCGWYWTSEEPWAWACYHYGSWVYDPVYGWVWVPGTEWAPAWVVWRESPDDGYIGWAPCGPNGAVVAPSLFVFVDTRHFRDHLHPERLIVSNTALINRTRVINNITSETRTLSGRRQKIAVNRGPGIDPVQRATGSRIAPRPIEQVLAKATTPAAPRRERAPQVTQSRQQTAQSPAAPPVSRQQQPQHIYHQPAPPPAPTTGRQEPRLYHEPEPAVPEASPPAPPASRTPTEPVAPNQVPRVSNPERLPPPASERGASPVQGNPPTGPKITPTPQTPPPRQVPPRAPDRGRDKDRDQG